MSGSLWWELTRASGIVAWLMLTASVLWGVCLSSRAVKGRRWLLDLHRWLGALTIGFVAVHVAALVADGYVHFGVADVAVPMASSWKPAAVALGIVAAWVLAAVEISSLAMKHLPKRAWRAIHLGSYATFFLTTFHGALAGSDASTPLYAWTSVVAVAVVVTARAFRVLTLTSPTGRTSNPGPGRAAVGSAAGAPVAVQPAFERQPR